MPVRDPPISLRFAVVCFINSVGRIQAGLTAHNCRLVPHFEISNLGYLETLDPMTTMLFVIML